MDMQVLTIDDLKNAIREVLSEQKQPPATEPEQYVYGLKGLADFLGVGETTAWTLKNSGRLPYYRSGKKFFFKKSEILQATATAKTL